MAAAAVCPEIAALDSHLDVILIDTGAGISRNVMRFVFACDEVIVVTTPELTAITDAYGVIKLLLTNNPSARVRVVVNMARTEAEAEKVLSGLQGVLSHFLKVNVSLELLGYIPQDSAVSRAIQEQSPLVLSYPNSKAAPSIDSIARRLVTGADPSKRRASAASFNGWPPSSVEKAGRNSKRVLLSCVKFLLLYRCKTAPVPSLDEDRGSQTGGGR